jgi:hypothetical protein
MAWDEDPAEARREKIKKPTALERGLLADFEAGQERKNNLLSYLSTLIRRGLVGPDLPGSPFADGLKPIVVTEAAGELQFAGRPHLRKADFDKEADEWPISY